MHFSCISHAYLRHILRHTLGTSQSYLIYLRNMSYKCWQILGIYLTYLMLISAISKANLREILENLRYIWGISKAYLSNIIWFLEDSRRESCWPRALRLDIEEAQLSEHDSRQVCHVRVRPHQHHTIKIATQLKLRHNLNRKAIKIATQ